MNNNNEGRTTENLVRCKATDIDDRDLNEHEKGVIAHQVTELMSPTHGMEEIEFAVNLFQGSLIIYASVRMPREDGEFVLAGARAVHRIVAAPTGRNPTVNEPQMTQAGGNDPWTDTNTNEQKIPHTPGFGPEAPTATAHEQLQEQEETRVANQFRQPELPTTEARWTGDAHAQEWTGQAQSRLVGINLVPERQITFSRF